jgi:hypothetical protein
VQHFWLILEEIGGLRYNRSMMKNLFACCFVVFLTQLSFAQQVPQLDSSLTRLFGNTREFTADMVLSYSSSTSLGEVSCQIAVTSGKIRYTIDMASMMKDNPKAAALFKQLGLSTVITIARPDLHETYILYPGKLAYIEAPFPQSAGETNALPLMKKLGEETVAGHVCSIEQLVTANGTDCRVWQAADLGDFPLKVVTSGLGLDSTTLFSNLKVGVQNADLFIPPASYTKYSSLQELMIKAMNSTKEP